LYFTTPFLVIGCWLANRRFAAPPRIDEIRLSGRTRWSIGLIGLFALAQGIFMFAAPSLVIPIWPWALTPLTCRVVGAIFCLGSAGIGVLMDSRWTAVKLMLQVECLMVALILIGAIRARTEFYTDRPVTYLMLGGLVGLLLASSYLWYSMEIRPRRTLGQPISEHPTSKGPG
jgi:hypothetical protein